MSFYRERVLPHLIDLTMKHADFEPYRRRVTGAAHGRVLEIGVGSGMNLVGTAEAIPLPDRSVDTVVITWTLCSIPELPKALGEVRRVLKPGGRFLFAEHGLAAEPNVVRWQHWLTPLWKRVAGGCHLNRPIDRMISSGPFTFNTFNAPAAR